MRLKYFASFTIGFMFAAFIWPLATIRFNRSYKKMRSMTEFRPELMPVYNYLTDQLDFGDALFEYDRLVIRNRGTKICQNNYGQPSAGSAQ